MFSFKDIKNRLAETDFCYIAFPDKKVCIEVEDIERGKAYIQTFGGIFYNHYPYEEYGFEDPYAFTEEWEVYGIQGSIGYTVDTNGFVQEVSHGII